jgi:transposase
MIFLFVIEDMIRIWAPDDFWAMGQPLIPVPASVHGAAASGGPTTAVLAAIVYLVQAGCSWPKLPASCSDISPVNPG